MKKENTSNKNVLTSFFEDIMEDRFGRYSKYIIQERALPDVRDGLKPVQRRILYAMHADGNIADRPHRKSAKTVGLVIGNFHPHGDSSVYEAMVRMSQTWKMRIPLVDMHGNNGSIDNDPAAAMRYTEARLSRYASLLLKDIDQETVLFTPNFDDSLDEPTVLPAQLPNLLINGTTGISAGYATNIPTHNLNEILQAVIYRILNPNGDLKDIMDIVKGPDFPTGGIVQGKNGIIDAFKSGKGKIIIRSKTEIVKTKTIQKLVIKEIPYEVVKSNLVKQIDDIRLSKNAQGILDVRDESDRNGLKIVVDIKKEIDPTTILNYLLKKTSLQISYNYNMVVIVNKRPMQLGLLPIIDAFVDHRQKVVLARSQYQLKRIEERTHILEGLIKAVSVMDEIITIIRSSKDKGDAKERLIDTFDFTDIQAEAIVTLRLYRLTSTDIFQLKDEFTKLMQQREILKAIIQDKDILNQLLIKELREVDALYEMPRISEIQNEVEEIVIDKQSMIVNERVIVTVSRDGYIKRVSIRSFNASAEDSLTGIKEEDHLIGTKECDLLDYLLLITSGGKYLYIPVYEILDAKWKDIGNHLNTLASINGDKIISAYIVKSLMSEAWIITLSKKGMIKRTMLYDLNTQRYNRTYNLMNLGKNDQVVASIITYINDEVIIATKGGNVVRYDLQQLPVTSLKAKGVKAINLNTNDQPIDLAVINEKKDTLVVINDKGGLKRIWLKDITNNNRPVKGDTLFTQKKSNPQSVLYIETTQTYDEIILINNGLKKLISKDISLMSKNSTFSNPLSLSKNWYLVKQIEAIKMIDLVIDDLKKNQSEKDTYDDHANEDFEFISFDV